MEHQSVRQAYKKMIESVSAILEILSLKKKLELDAEFSGLNYEQLIFKKFQNVRLIIGPSNISLGENILENLGIPKVECNIGFYSDKSPLVEIKENIRGTNMFIVQTGANDEKHSLNDYSEQLLAMIDACKRSGTKSITTIIPYYQNARSDKRDAPRVPIMAKATTQKFENAGVDRIIMIDLHSGQIQGFSDKPIDNLYAKPLFTSYLQNKFKEDNMTIEDMNRDYILVSPDAGGYKRVYAYSETLNINNIIMHKERDYSIPNKVSKCVIVGNCNNIKGKKCIIFDDMIDTAGTLVSCVSELGEAGAIEVIPIATHGVFSGPAMERINNCEYIKQIVVTNSLPQDENIKKCTKKMIVINTAPLLAYTIVCLRFGGSISELFKMNNIKYK